MNATGWIILIVVVVVVIAIIVVIAMTAGRRRKLDADRHKAEELRVAARDDDLAAREREAKASRAEADAKEAEVEAERRRREAEAHASEARDARASVDEKLTRADQVDPDVRTERSAERAAPAERTEQVADGERREPRHSEPRIDVGGPETANGGTDVPPPRPAR